MLVQNGGERWYNVGPWIYGRKHL